MTTSTHDGPRPTDRERLPLRLRLAPSREGRLDGAWWPQSRDLEAELADLVDHAPAEVGRIARVLYSPPDWDGSARRVRVGRGFLKVGSFPRDDTHVVILTTLDRTTVTLLVVPSSASESDGAEALAAGGDPARDLTAHDALRNILPG